LSFKVNLTTKVFVINACRQQHRQTTVGYVKFANMFVCL